MKRKDFPKVNQVLKNQMNLSSLLLRDFIYRLCNELLVGIVSKLEQRTKKEKKSGCGELNLFVPTVKD